MLRTRFFLLIPLLILSFSCTKKVDLTEKVLNIAITSEVKGMDPIFSNDAYSAGEIAKVYEGLLEYHYLKRPYTLVPNLAEKMPEVSQDGLTYTFKIKKGVLFQDDKIFKNGKGRELVAEDFVYSLKRLADPKLQSTGWWLLQGKIVGLDEWREKYSKSKEVSYQDEIEGLKALDKYTLQFKLKKPFPQFLYSLAMPFTFVVAREAVEGYDKEFLNHPIGTGPFKLPVFSRSNQIVYTKNPTFRKKLFPSDSSEEFDTPNFKADAGKPLPLMDKIVVNLLKEDQPRWLNFKKGKIDYIGIPKDNFSSAITSSLSLSPSMEEKGISLLKNVSLDVTYIAFNLDMDLFQNVHLRRAMSLAYDPAESNNLFYNNLGVPAQSVVPPGIAGHLDSYKNPYIGPKLEEAKKHLVKAGYPEGKGLPEITYDATASTISRQMGEFFQQKMAKIGIKIKVQTHPWPQFQELINNRKVQLFGIAWGADYPDAENFLQLLYGPNKSPGANGSGFDDPEFNKLYESAAKLQDSPERTALYEKMYRIAAETVPWVFGLHRQNFILRHAWLRNYIPADFDHGQAQYLNVDLEAKKKTLEKL